MKTVASYGRTIAAGAAALILALTACSSGTHSDSTRVPVTVTFDLNYTGSSGAPASRSLNQGSLVSQPADRVRTGFIFGGWFSDAACTDIWEFTADTVSADITLYAKWTAESPPSGQITSLEFGHTTSHNDYCAPVTLPDGFGNGFLFTVWTKITNVITAGTYRGNQNILHITGTNWELVCLNGNLGVLDSGYARYNSNFMLGDAATPWIGDFCTYYSLESEQVPLAAANDWVWSAWQVVINSDGTMTLRQWIKFGADGTVYPAGHWSDTDGPGEETVIAGTVSVEGWNIPADFSAGPLVSFRIGDDNTWSGHNTPSSSWLCLAKLYARSDKPTIEELESIAMNTDADTSAWADWELCWRNGAADISDRSGHGHHLTMQEGGELTGGGTGPDLSR